MFSDQVIKFNLKKIKTTLVNRLSKSGIGRIMESVHQTHNNQTNERNSTCGFLKRDVKSAKGIRDGNKIEKENILLDWN